VQFYRTTAPLRVPDGVDASIAFTLDIPRGATSQVRAVLWVNGYNFGLWNPWVGKQRVFPVPTGVLDLQGENTIAISVWNQDEDVDAVARVSVGWRTEYVHESGFDFGFDASRLRPSWDEGRSVYI